MKEDGKKGKGRLPCGNGKFGVLETSLFTGQNSFDGKKKAFFFHINPRLKLCFLSVRPDESIFLCEPLQRLKGWPKEGVAF